jgi:hypothetical protein
MPHATGLPLTQYATCCITAAGGTGARFKVIKDLPEVNAAQDGQFSQFFDRAFQRFPPSVDRQYFLIMSDHGAGFKGLGSDHVCKPGQRFDEDHACADAMLVANFTQGEWP